MKSSKILVILACALALAILEYTLGGNDATLLVTLSFWIGIFEGPVALAAITEVVGAKWIAPMKGELLSVRHLLPLPMILLIPFAKHMSVFPWMESPHGLWFNPDCFIARNVILLVLAYLLAWRLSVNEGSSRGRLYAVLYLWTFAASLTVVAVDLVMSLEYPWTSTLFGCAFFVESVIAGVAIGALIYCFNRSRIEAVDPKKKALWDIATMMFGFSILWVGLAYTHYLVIWYGNLSEETFYLIKRMNPPYLWVSMAVLVMMAVIPFSLLLSRAVASNKRSVGAIALIILAGLFVERLLFVLPVDSVTINIPLLIVETIVPAYLLASILFQPDGVAGHDGRA